MQAHASPPKVWWVTSAPRLDDCYASCQLVQCPTLPQQAQLPCFNVESKQQAAWVNDRLQILDYHVIFLQACTTCWPQHAIQTCEDLSWLDMQTLMQTLQADCDLV